MPKKEQLEIWCPLFGESQVSESGISRRDTDMGAHGIFCGCISTSREGGCREIQASGEVYGASGDFPGALEIRCNDR